MSITLILWAQLKWMTTSISREAQKIIDGETDKADV